LTGTCTDVSAGSSIKGTACISDESMGGWMAYKFMGRAMPSNVIGVDVHLSCIDPNGNFEYIGAATVDIEGNYNFEWTPPVPGTYQITASFLGTNSYWPSEAHTTIYVNSESVPTETATPTPVEDNTTQTYVLGSAAAIIATFVILAAVILMTLRKRP
jgi:hypothetical protein